MYHNTYLRNNKVLQRILYGQNLQVHNLILPFLLVDSDELVQSTTAYSMQPVTQDMLYKQLAIYTKKGLHGILLSLYTTAEMLSPALVEKRSSSLANSIRYIKQMYPELLIIVDISTTLANKDYMFGIERNGTVNIDATIDILTELAVLYAKAGVDILLHSGMLHTLTRSIKKTLQSHSIYHVALMSYAMQAKDAFASLLKESPEKEHVGIYASKEQFMAIAHHEVRSGVDILVVSPLMLSFDAMATIANTIDLPLFAFHTSTEYSVLRCAIENGLIDEEESLCSLCFATLRAGAKAIITPYTPVLLDILNKS
ncbi:MAG: hypothetical protein K2M30_04595 [Desulfovibrionaceae bacterium]|nr:hypothetical protein [Desulfovibrionaceae bacterium]